MIPHLRMTTPAKYLPDIGLSTVCTAFKHTKSKKKPAVVKMSWLSFRISAFHKLKISGSKHLAPSGFPRACISQSQGTVSLHIMIAYIFLKQSVPFDLSYAFELSTPKREVSHPEVAKNLLINKLRGRDFFFFF